MKSFLALLAVGVVLMAASTATAGWAYAAAGPAVYGYYPIAPVYTYPAYPGPVPMVVARPVVPVVAPAPFVYGPAPVVYGYPYVVRSRVYVPGQPVRNTLRAVFP
ncbi:MAG: hypothetical protein JW809_16415 [Pirellulales bacterium]|nr:hypothetical protein [Pirellulales bacterium]